MRRVNLFHVSISDKENIEMMKMRHVFVNRTFLLGVCFLMIIVRAGLGETARPAFATESVAQQTSQGILVLQKWYNPQTGLYDGTGWWNSANAITVLTDYARATNTKKYNQLLANTLVRAQLKSPGFINDYYDDEGWWALAWIDAYDLTGDQKYLMAAESIFVDMVGGWDQTCGGGIWWSKERHYKNAIANELFFSVAAHLANRDQIHREQYFGWADRSWKWFAATGMINGQNLVNDGLTSANSQADATSCKNNGQTAWSYNQGVLLGGLVEFSRIDRTASPALLQTAHKIATAAITRLVDRNGVLHDSCEPDCGADGVQFKGIFVRNLVSLYKASPQPAYKEFIDTNAKAILNSGRSSDYQFDQRWSGAFSKGDAASQSSALDALVGAIVLD
jgi:predicted alpha-1,6-mannanase (GH76 family)